MLTAMSRWRQWPPLKARGSTQNLRSRWIRDAGVEMYQTKSPDVTVRWYRLTSTVLPGWLGGGQLYTPVPTIEHLMLSLLGLTAVQLDRRIYTSYKRIIKPSQWQWARGALSLGHEVALTSWPGHKPERRRIWPSIR